MPLARLKNAVPLEFRKGSIDTTTNLLECKKCSRSIKLQIKKIFIYFLKYGIWRF